jgi:HK97 family phage prohead protease
MRIEIRSDSVILDGYVNVTQRESRVLPSPRGRFVEEIMPKTFERALQKNGSVDLLFNHDKSRKLGSTAEGNLELREDNVGLRATATVYDKEVMEKARKGELRGWSFGFAAVKDTWKTREDGMQKRILEEINLFEVSVLDKAPAYIATSIEARGEEEVLSETRSEEFQANIEDNSEKAEDNTGKTTEHKEDEKRDIPEPFYFEQLDHELTLTQLRGGF